MSQNAFLDQQAIRGDLYSRPGRLARRTGALLSARVGGAPVPGRIVELARRQLGPTISSVLDVGCGRGSTTAALATALPEADVVAVDLSIGLLQAGRTRQGAISTTSHVQADFNHLPFKDATFDLVIAAFCLYHSPDPGAVIRQLSRCLRSDGIAILITKSVDSYRAIDELLHKTGIDPEATERTSLYSSAHSGNLAALAAAHLHVVDVVHEKHEFAFLNRAHLADYIATVPKYRLPERLQHVDGALAAELRRRAGEDVLHTDSTVTYVMGRVPD